MTSDIKLNDGSDSTWITAEATVLQIKGSDIILDSAQRRSSNGGHFRRAIVHDQNDGLTINYNNDYPGGVTINGLKTVLPVLTQTGAPRLPKVGVPGELVVVSSVADAGGFVIGEAISLWVCEGTGRTISGARWRKVDLGEAVIGTI
jgi:hypothetical protein